MDKDHILRIIEFGENQEVEFKESFHSNQEFSKIMCGFVNAFGGVILVGVNSKKEIIGVKGDIDLIQQKIASSAQAVSPPLLPVVEVHNFDNKTVIAIILQKAIDGVFHTFQGVIWAKMGSILKKVEGNQIVDFLRGKQILCFDESPSNANIDDIDNQKVKEYLLLRKQTDYLKSHSIEDFLLSMKLASKNGRIIISLKNRGGCRQNFITFSKNHYLGDIYL